MTHPESQLQRACVTWFRLQYPKYLIYANANGGKRSKIEAAIMKAEGVTAGVPDLTVVLPGRVVWIELKVMNRKVSYDQIDVMQRLLSLDHECYVVRSIDEFIKVINLIVKR